MGFLQHRGINKFNDRVITRNGRITAEECKLFAGERFADTVERIGFDKAQEMILGEGLLERKDEILN